MKFPIALASAMLFLATPVDASPLDTPTDLQAVPDPVNGTVLLTWSAPASGTPDEYRVYVNGLLVAEIPGTSLVVPAGDLMMAVTVTAVTDEVESAPAVVFVSGRLVPGCSLFHLVSVYTAPGQVPPIVVTHNIVSCLPFGIGHLVECAILRTRAQCV